MRANILVSRVADWTVIPFLPAGIEPIDLERVRNAEMPRSATEALPFLESIGAAAHFPDTWRLLALGLSNSLRGSDFFAVLRLPSPMILAGTGTAAPKKAIAHMGRRREVLSGGGPTSPAVVTGVHPFILPQKDVWGDQVYCAEGLPTPDEVREEVQSD